MPIMVEPRGTIAASFARSVAAHSEEPALGFVRAGELHWRTWREVADEAAQLASAIQAAGIDSGDRVAHISENRYDWIITDLAIHLASAVHVPIHITLSGEQIAAQIADCEARLVFASSAELAASFSNQLDKQVPIWLHDVSQKRSSQLHRAGWRAAAPPPSPQPPDASLATILYTSGTTGRPRGVMLSHANLASNAAATAEAFGAGPELTRLCILPLSHIYARLCDLYTWVYRGSRLVIGESRDTLARDCQLVRPTGLNAVPYLYQRIADKIRESSSDDESAALRSFFGGQMEWLTCGGAPLAPAVEDWYASRGLPIHCGYGLTESSPVIAMSTSDSRRAGSVGRVLPGVEVRISEDGEILARGPNIMLGYWHDDAASADAVRDGWLCTGDLGSLDEDGYLYIRGRKKELIVLSTGKKVTPSHIESLLTSSPLIEQAAVFGDGQCGIVALIVPAAPLGESSTGCLARDEYQREITRCLASSAHEEQIHRFVLIDRPFSIERGELTPKLSLRRAVIASNFAAELEELL
jgi:long-chain acyl-CoA synthetase